MNLQGQLYKQTKTIYIPMIFHFPGLVLQYSTPYVSNHLLTFLFIFFNVDLVQILDFPVSFSEMVIQSFDYLFI